MELEQQTIGQTEASFSDVIESLAGKVSTILSPPPELHIHEWAERNFVLSVGNSAQTGRYRLSKTPYLREPFEAIKNPQTQEIALQFAAQTAKSTMILATLGYAISEEPSPILFVMPSLNDAETFSKDRVAPMIRDSERLNSLIDDKARDSSNTILHKQFSNGAQITLVGANSPSSLRSKPCRWIFIDEVSSLPASSGVEGDPVALAKKRASTFYNRKIIMTSTPSIMATCRMHQLMTDAQTRLHKFEVRCPHCSNYIFLEWNQVYWKDEDASTAYYECQECKGHIRESHKSRMLASGRWRCLNPEVGYFRQGFKLNALYSPWVTFEEMAREYLGARRNQEMMKTFVNTYLGEAYEAESEGVEHAQLFMRREAYPKGVDVPKGGLVLTAGVDVQDDRLECEVVAWGKDERESWSVAYHVLWGDPGEKRTWQQLTDLLDKKFRHEWGFELTIAATCIDSGGHHTQAVYEYVKEQRLKRVFAVKGMGGEGRALVSSPYKRRTGRDRRPVDLYIIGVDSAKAILYQRLRIAEPGPGYCHFPRRDEYDQTHFKNLVAEKCVTVYKNNIPTRKWVLPEAKNNEQLDVRIYSMAAVQILNPIFPSIESRFIRQREALLSRMEQGYDSGDAGTGPTIVYDKPGVRKITRKNNRHSYVNSWRDF